MRAPLTPFLLAYAGQVAYDGDMSSKVSAEQLESVRLWASQGIDLNGIQKKLASECGVHMTYMDVRFLLLDHGIEIAQPAAVKPTMSLDELQIPGTILSGKCEFPSGTKVSWQIDQMGQLACEQLSGTMTPDEQQAFVFELRQILSKM